MRHPDPDNGVGGAGGPVAAGGGGRTGCGPTFGGGLEGFGGGLTPVGMNKG